jgi:hypothetical protein
MGANNHPTVIPNENAADSRERVNDSIHYDSDNSHDMYMLDLRLSGIRAGVVDTHIEE